MIPEIPPPPDKVPDYVLYSRRYNRPYLPRPKKLAPEILAAEYVHPNLESALLSAKKRAPQAIVKLAKLLDELKAHLERTSSCLQGL